MNTERQKLHLERVRQLHLGTHLSDETKAKIAKAHTGKKLSQEHKEKIGRTSRGRIQSMETRMKHSLALRGEKSYQWRGGISPLLQLIRHCFLTRQWRSDIFNRDDYTCVLCGIRSGRGKHVDLEADHYPKTFAEIFYQYGIKNLEDAVNCDELWNLNNGRTLCKNCHRKTETHGRKYGGIRQLN